jgi:hypothetical protein
VSPLSAFLPPREDATLRIDHVIVGVSDLDQAGPAFLDRYGLDSVEGGRHAGWGTANRVVPLGPDYLELLGVTDPAEAAASPTGQWLAAVLPEGDRPLAWAVSTDDLDGVASRLGVEVLPGERERPDGIVLRWRMAGVERAMSEPSLPFFISWDVPPELHPGRAAATHRVEPRGIGWVQVGGDEARVRAWLGDADLPVRVAEGAPGLHAVGVAAAGGEIVVR